MIKWLLVWTDIEPDSSYKELIFIVDLTSLDRKTQTQVTRDGLMS